MNFLFWIAATIALIVTPIAIILFFAVERYRRRSKKLEIQLAALNAQLEALNKNTDDIKELRDRNSSYLEQKSAALTELQELQKKIAVVTTERDAHLHAKEEAVKARLEAEKKLGLIEQKMQDTEKRMQDWELQRSEALKAAKASILEAGSQLSTKLLEDHKREAETAKKETEALAKKATEALFEKMTAVSEKVAALNNQTNQTQEKMATVWKALASPSGAGFLAEVGLENSLKNLGLEPMRDYITQYAISSEEAGNLRPDAVIFLPQDMVMVIDSKASKFLLELAAAENTESEILLLQKLKKTMNEHLKALTSKDYGAAIKAFYKEAGRGGKIRSILNVMYLPTENAVDHIKRADPEFVHKCEKSQIILAGPTGIAGLLSVARLNIGLVRQAENQDAIVTATQELLSNVVVALDYATKIGKGLKNAKDSFDKFASSVNSRMLPKMKQLVSLGVKPDKNKEIPSRITNSSDEMMVIEGEVEEAA